MYTWGYIKDVTLAKLDLEEDEANKLNLIRRFSFYANEAITQISSTVKPKRMFATLEITEEQVGKPITISDADFIGFGDDVNTIIYNEYGTHVTREAHDKDFSYCGYNQIIPYRTGTFIISYNARWITFLFDDGESGQDDYTDLNVPMDILECLPSYIASQCMRIDDDYKSSVFRNEYEILLSRIDDTNYKNTKTFDIGGDW